MKLNINKIIAAIIVMLLYNCDKDNCDYVPTCEPLSENAQNAGLTIVTYHSSNPNDLVASIYDTRNNISAPIGTDWGISLSSGGKILKPSDWTMGNLGRIFGIAVDNSSNIYFASSGVYNQYINSGAGLVPYVNANPGRIYKATAGSSYSISTLVDLPVTSSVGSLSGIGNIAYDKINNQLFATNLDDGKIYRISMAGSIVQTYDPFAPDDNTPDITTKQEERIWAIGVNYEKGKVKVYFPRVTSSTRELYSLTLNTDGTLPTTPPVKEIENLSGNQLAITDIEFSADGKKILLAERGDPHSSISFSYNLSNTSWVFYKQYAVGGHSTLYKNPNNSAGGVDFGYRGDDNTSVKNCEEFVWSTGNLLFANSITGTPQPYLYGLQGINYSGNILSTSPSTDLFIDFDTPNYTWNTGIGKGEIGDVDVIDANGCFCVIK